MAANVELYKFEDYVEGAALTILTKEGITAVTSREDEQVSTPYVEVQYNNGESKEILRASGSLYLNQRWGGQLQCTVVTDRKNNRTSHSTLRATVRSIFNSFSSFNSGSIMPYHTMTDLTEAQTLNEISEEDNKDISVLVFNTLLDIKPSAWS